VADGLPVWPEYVDSTHCKAHELSPGLPLHIGMDFGLTPAAVIGQRLPNGQARWRYELAMEDTGVTRFARALKAFMAEKCPGFKIASITGDPAGDQRQPGDNEERTVFELLAAEGIVAQPAPFNNDFTIRSEAVSKPMLTMIDGQPALLIHPDMKVTRKGMQGAYKFRRLKVAGDERYENKPVKNKWSHPCEALQYGQLGHGLGQRAARAQHRARAEDAQATGRCAAMTPSSDARAFRTNRGLR
jgi:hypothetical protein